MSLHIEPAAQAKPKRIRHADPLRSLRRWSCDEIAALRDAYALPERRTFRALCHKLGRTEGAAIKRLQCLGIIKTARPSILPARTRGGLLGSKKTGGRCAIELARRASEPEPLGTDRGCQWLHGPAGPRFFCGHQKVAGTNWCQHHLGRVYRKEKSVTEISAE